MSDEPTDIPETADGFDPWTYGESFADVYDDWYPAVSDTAATVGHIAGIAGGAALDVLELGTGTGRLTRALTDAGHRAVGLDASPAMLRRFDAPGSEAVGADMAYLPFAEATFDLVLIATNTLFNLADVALQARCFADSARVLRPGGHLVVEADVPAGADPALDRLVSTRSIDADRVVLTATIRDADAGTVTGQHIEITEAGIRLRPWRIRFSSPEELDAMAAEAGLGFAGRWSDWDGAAFDDESTHHVSRWTAPQAASTRSRS